MTYIFNKKTIYIKIQFGKQILYRNYEITSETVVKNLLLKKIVLMFKNVFVTLLGNSKSIIYCAC